MRLNQFETCSQCHAAYGNESVEHERVEISLLFALCLKDLYADDMHFPLFKGCHLETITTAVLEEEKYREIK